MNHQPTEMNGTGLYAVIGGIIGSAIAAITGAGGVDTHLLFNPVNLSQLLFESVKVCFMGGLGGAAGWVVKKMLDRFEAWRIERKNKTPK